MLNAELRKLERKKELAHAKIGVFWDVCDFPVTDIFSFSENIRSALVNEGYDGAVSITAYGDHDDDQVVQQYKDARITFVSRGSKLVRIYKMLMDIHLWELDNRATTGPTNMLAISSYMIPKNEEEEEAMFSCYMSMFFNGGSNVLLAVPDHYKIEDMLEEMPPLNLIWYWSDLLSGGKPIDNSLLEVKYKSHCDCFPPPSPY